MNRAFNSRRTLTPAEDLAAMREAAEINAALDLFIDAANQATCGSIVERKPEDEDQEI